MAGAAVLQGAAAPFLLELIKVAVPSGSRMSLFGFFRTLVWGRGFGVGELANRLGVDAADLKQLEPQYRQFSIPKRSGGMRQLSAPSDKLKRMQRRILRRLLSRLRAHPAVHGFERGRSIVSNAAPHQGQDVVLRLDLVDFFTTTHAQRIKKYFRRSGWNRPAATLLTHLCTHEGGLPQGAPTSPRLSNLVNYRLDARLAGMAAALGGVYTRYADDITISFPPMPEHEWVVRVGNAPPMAVENQAAALRYMLRFVRRAARDEGYRVHRRKKLSVRRRHHQQLVTGLVVNDGVNLPRKTRRWLRAVAHRARQAKRSPLDFSGPSWEQRRAQPTLSAAQLEGWQALQAMIESQRD